MSNMHELRINAVIRNQTIKYLDKQWREKLRNFKIMNNGHALNVYFEVADSPEYFQHKYYRGFLLPDVAFNLGESDPNYVHEFILKPKFLMVKVNNWKDIPDKHRKQSRIVVHVATKLNECREEDEVTELVGYVPSTARISFIEMNEYIKKVEMMLDEMGGHLGDSAGVHFESYHTEAVKLRSAFIGRESSVV